MERCLRVGNLIPEINGKVEAEISEMLRQKRVYHSRVFTPVQIRAHASTPDALFRADPEDGSFRSTTPVSSRIVLNFWLEFRAGGFDPGPWARWNFPFESRVFDVWQIDCLNCLWTTNNFFLKIRKENEGEETWVKLRINCKILYRSINCFIIPFLL